jgi:hypothetical protein
VKRPEALTVMVAVGGVGAAVTVLINETVEGQEREPVDETLAHDETLLLILPLRVRKPLPELLSVATPVRQNVGEGVVEALTEEELQKDADWEAVDDTLTLGVALPLPLPLREDELHPEPLRVAAPVRQCVGESVVQLLVEEVLQYEVARDPVRMSAGLLVSELEPVRLPEAVLLFPHADCSSCTRNRSDKTEGKRSMASNQRAGEI